MITITAIEILNNKITAISQELFVTENDREALGEYRDTHTLYDNQFYYFYNYDTEKEYTWKGSDIPKNLESNMDNILYQFQSIVAADAQQLTDSVIMVTIPNNQPSSVVKLENLAAEYDFEIIFHDCQDKIHIMILKLN